MQNVGRMRCAVYAIYAVRRALTDLGSRMWLLADRNAVAVPWQGRLRAGSIGLRYKYVVELNAAPDADQPRWHRDLKMRLVFSYKYLVAIWAPASRRSLRYMSEAFLNEIVI
mgnify:CR=1 FL=1